MGESLMRDAPKLVRDGVPAIIDASGKHAVTRVLGESEMTLALRHKLQEETSEYLDDPCLEELGDILEVIHALLGSHHATWDQLEAVRIAKRSTHGGFEERVLLIDVQ
ncbi:nucleoside triphosphate pyrophosphohydrolase [Ferrimicrobium sp.]|uniref:nucleoside triphosphate pyrophosphohydrolase n=1 Tax=Ferrimicrobium sp. TaxID=2926050 RepID=UPI00261A678E|nr:nucleoside triphosphate pyrophosphohydrolase [Ferrimicrobium sp.]